MARNLADDCLWLSLSHGTDVNQPDHVGKNALHHALEGQVTGIGQDSDKRERQFHDRVGWCDAGRTGRTHRL